MRRRDLLAVLLLLGVIGACVGEFVLVGRSIERERRSSDARAAREVEANVERELASAVATIAGTADFVGASRLVSGSEFTFFAQRGLRRPGIRALGLVDRLSGRDRRAWERSNGTRVTRILRPGVLAPAGRRDVYYPVRFLRARTPSPVDVTGLDVAAEPERRATLAAAARAGAARATPPLRAASGRWSVFVYVPVERGARLAGDPAAFAIGSLELGDLFRAALAGQRRTTYLAVTDGGRTVFRTQGEAANPVARAVSFAGRTWTIDVSKAPTSATMQALRWLALALGVLLTLFLAGLILRLRGVARTAEALVRRRTQELRERNAELVEANRAKDEVVGLVSHELRSPLTAIIGYLDLALEEELEGFTRDALAVARRNADRAVTLTGDLVFAARVDAGRLELDRARVDLGELVRQAVESAAPAAVERGISIDVDLAGAGIVDGDELRLAQLLDNLVSNAIKYGRDGGSARVLVQDAPGGVELAVADDGAGIPEAEQPHLFERFYRASATRRIHGNGLGLNIVRAIVEAHGGEIRFESSPATGTTFFVTLPAAAGVGAASRETAAASAA